MFYLCDYSAIDSAYPKYPALPVIQCPAYKAPLDISSASPHDQ